MIENVSTGFNVYCDECGTEEFFATPYDFDGLRAKMREYGWITRKNKEWEHYCHDCS